MDLSEIQFLSGNDIPFPEARLVLHQPTIKEIAYIGEDTFFTGCELLNFNKDNLPEEDKIHLEDKTNFEVLIAIMKEQNITIQRQKVCIEMVLSLVFPEYNIEIKDNYISLKKAAEEEEFKITNNNFEEFKRLLRHMFALDIDGEEGSDYNPSGDLAKRIADKMKKRHQKLQQVKGESKISVLGRYISILAVGEQKDMNSLLQYTVYQLSEEFRRYQLKLQWDITLQAKMAGAKDLQDVEDWMKDFHSENKDN